MDSLGGILIKGLLGNPILGHFNLFFFGITIEESPTPTPTVTPTPTPTYDPEATPSVSATPAVSATLVPVTPTPLPDTGFGGGGGAIEERKKAITIRIRFKGNEYVSQHRVDERILRISINILGYLNKAKEKLSEISLKFRGKPTKTEIKSVKVQVKKNDD